MIDGDHPERVEVTEQDLAIAALIGRYIGRREHHQASGRARPAGRRR